MVKAKDDATELLHQRAAADRERGFRGVEMDPTPNEHYTVSGVTAGKPTPETDDELNGSIQGQLAAQSMAVSRDPLLGWKSPEYPNNKAGK